MYKKLKKIFLVMSILGVLFTNTYAEEVKEVQLIDDFSAELLGEPKDQEPAVQKSPVKQDTQEVTENKDENKQNEKIVNKETEKPVEKKDKKDLTEVIEKAIEDKKNNDKNLALEEVEDPKKDKQKYEMIKYYSADGVEWKLPDNFRAVIVGDTKGNVIFAKDADTMYPLASVTKMMSLMLHLMKLMQGIFL